VGEMSERIFHARRKTQQQMHFWPSAARPYQRSDGATLRAVGKKFMSKT